MALSDIGKELNTRTETIIVREGLDRYRKDIGELERLAESIKTYGQLQPILLTDSDELIDGGRRLAACIMLGIRVKAVYIKNLTDLELRERELEANIQRKAFTPAEEACAVTEIHKLRQLRYGEATSGKKDSGWTLEQTAVMLGKTRGYVIEQQQIAQTLDQFPELAKLKTKKEIKKVAYITQILISRLANSSSYEEVIKESGIPVELIKGDAREHMKSMKDGEVDLLLTDPPFGIDIDKNAIQIGGNTGGDFSTSGFKFEDGKEMALELLTHLAVESYRFCSSTAHAFIFVAPEYFPLVREMFIAVGWLVNPRPIVWIKRESGQNNAPHAWPSASYEFILMARKAESRLIQQGKPDWIQCDPVLASKKIHPTEKPTSLLEELIGRSTDFNKLVYDPFCGSAATLEAAFHMRCRGIGVEILDEAYASACERMAKAIKREKEMETRINASSSSEEGFNGAKAREESNGYSPEID